MFENSANEKVISFPNLLNKLYETDTEKINRLESEVSQLREELGIERKFRYDAEQHVKELTSKIQQMENEPLKRKRRTKEELSKEIFEYTEFKSDGKRKARPAESIRSYSDFKSVQDYFLSQNKLRDWMMWTIGVSLGLRISDLLSLKICDLLNEDLSFKKRIHIVEQKTSKLNNCLITDAVTFAIKKYFDSINWNFEINDYLFKSYKTKGKMYEEYGWKILSDAGKALNLPIVLGSHTMRKSFANIATCVDKSNIDMNAITKVQGLLNHSNQKVTMKYLGTLQDMFDRARVAVSDFVLGKTDVDTLVAGNNYTIDDLMQKLELLEANMKEKK